MRAMRAVAAVVAAGASTALLVGLAPAASAATWTKTSATKSNAYSWNGYKATVGAAGFSLPSGHVKVANTITVKKSGTTVASNVTSARLSAGTYTVYSTFKYRQRIAYTAYRSVALDAFTADSCKVDGWSKTHSDDGLSYVSGWYGFVCTGTGWDADYNDVTATIRVDRIWGDGTMTSDPDWTWYTDPGYTQGQSVDPADINEDGYQWGVTGTQAYTAYKYGTTKVAYRYRTHTVTKIVNTSVMTKTEYNAFGAGDSYARVKAIVGSSGSLRWMSGGLSCYRWTNTSGGYTYVWFDGGYWYDDAWYAG